MKQAIAAMALLAGLSATGWAQGETNLTSLLSGKTTMALKDVGPNFKRLTVTGISAGGGGMDLGQLAMLGALGEKSGKGGPAEAMGAMIGVSLLGSMLGGGSGGGLMSGGETVLYTDGAVVSIGGESFLVAYRYKKPAMNLMQMAMEPGAGGKEPDFAKMAAEGKMSADSLLTLTLVNVRSIATLSDIRSFDLQRELAEAPSGGGLMDLIAAGMMSGAKDEKAAPPRTTPRPKPAAGARPRPR